VRRRSQLRNRLRNSHLPNRLRSSRPRNHKQYDGANTTDAARRAGSCAQNSVPFNAAVTNAGLARQDRRQAFNALLPSVTYDNSAIYTQSAGPIATAATGVPVIFIANNAVHEYVSQANVHEAIDVAGIANYRKVSATAAIAKWQAEIASRGLVVVVTQGITLWPRRSGNWKRPREMPTRASDFLRWRRTWKRGEKWPTQTSSRRNYRCVSDRGRCRKRNWLFLMRGWISRF